MVAIAPLGSQVASGFSLMLLQSIAAKAISAVGQIILAWYLRPEEFGIVGLAYTISVFIILLQQAGLREILIRRSATFEKWANVAFWMSLATGVSAALVTIAVAPFAARMYGAASSGVGLHRQELVPILYVLAIAMPINAAAIVPMAKLQIDLRFRVVTAIALGQSTLTLVLSCFLAAHGYGAYSFVLPVPLGAAVTTALLWYLAAPPIRRSPQLRKWRFVAGESAKLIVAGAFIHATIQGGAFALGIFHHDDAEIGMYAFAFATSLQITHLLTFNLGSVLFPALSRLGAEPARQRAAFYRAVRLLLLAGVPMCILQSAMADPLLRALFASKWSGAILPLQILSFGMAFNLAIGPCINFLLTLGRTNTVLHLSIAAATTFMMLVLCAAAMGGASAVATAMAIHAVVFGHVYVVAAARASGGAAQDVVLMFAKPVALGLLAVGPGWLLYEAIGPLSKAGQIAFICSAVPLAMLVTIALLKVTAPDELQELLRHVKGRLSRGR